MNAHAVFEYNNEQLIVRFKITHQDQRKDPGLGFITKV